MRGFMSASEITIYLRPGTYYTYTVARISKSYKVYFHSSFFKKKISE